MYLPPSRYQSADYISFHFKFQNQIWKDLENTAIFARPSKRLTLDEERELAVERQYDIYPKKYISMEQVRQSAKYIISNLMYVSLVAASIKSGANAHGRPCIYCIRAMFYYQKHLIVWYVFGSATYDGQQRVSAAALRGGRIW